MLASENMSETMNMLSLYNSVLNFLLMTMSFTTELLMFIFMFSAYLALSLSSVAAANVMCMGTGAMLITTVLTCLALTIAASLRIATAHNYVNYAYPITPGTYVFTFELSVVTATCIENILNALVAAGFTIVSIRVINGRLVIVCTHPGTSGFNSVHAALINKQGVCTKIIEYEHASR
jgi:hypothetical protein